jgi:peptidoglycan/LPS O-acetylase OafA/YrhL
MKKFEIIDFLKGYSIFTIVIFHYLQTINLPSPYNRFINFGGTGVHLFILLSGLGLYLSYLNKPEGYLTYLRKRFSKVYIPYVLVVLISALITVFYKIYEGSWYALGGHVFLYKMFDEKIIGSFGYPLWFISMIFQFYFVFYIIIYFKEKIKKEIIFLLVSIIISISWAILVLVLEKESIRVWNSFFLKYIWEFVLGMVIASFLHKGFKFENRLTPITILLIGIVGCAIYGSMVLLMGEVGNLFNDIPALIGYSFIAIWLYLLNNKWMNEFFLFTGKVSYSLYLIHTLIISIIALILGNLSPISIAVIALLLSYLSSYYYQFVINKIYKLLKI